MFEGLLTLIAGITIIRAEEKADLGLRPLDLVATLPLSSTWRPSADSG